MTTPRPIHGTHPLLKLVLHRRGDGLTQRLER